MTARYYISVVHRRQVEIAQEEGFVSFSHGREAFIKPLNPGDKVIYYAPKSDMDGTPVRAFIAHATVTGDVVETRDFGDWGQGFIRSATFDDVTDIPVAQIRDQLDFVPDGPSWGTAFRNGKREISADDYSRLAGALLGGTP
ncbi:hypothetical protein AADZ90_004945 [Aestuariibius sp. 2305UL40-4]|uniref:hypothetical protein n=1 Tax=Aestuariibius violaceus TaxID=3234132 RepID=UPI00345E8075